MRKINLTKVISFVLLTVIFFAAVSTTLAAPPDNKGQQKKAENQTNKEKNTGPGREEPPGQVGKGDVNGNGKPLNGNLHANWHACAPGQNGEVDCEAPPPTYQVCSGQVGPFQDPWTDYVYNPETGRNESYSREYWLDARDSSVECASKPLIKWYYPDGNPDNGDDNLTIPTDFCPSEPLLVEFWNASARQWDVHLFDASDPESAPRLLGTPTITVDYSVRFPTVSPESCRWSGQSSLEELITTEVLDFSGTVLQTLRYEDSELLQPEWLPNLEEDIIISVRKEDKQLLEFNLDTQEWKDLEVQGQYPHSLVFPDGEYIVGYQTTNKTIGRLTSSGESLTEIGNSCRFVEWSPSGLSIWCSTSSGSTLYALNGTQLMTVDHTGAVALDPDESGRGVISNNKGVTYFSNLEKAFGEELIDNSQGWGSDWGGIVTFPSLSFEEAVQQ